MKVLFKKFRLWRIIWFTSWLGKKNGNIDFLNNKKNFRTRSSVLYNKNNLNIKKLLLIQVQILKKSTL